MNRSGFGDLAADLMFLNKIEHHLGCGAKTFHELWTVGVAKLLAHLSWRMPDSCVDEANISSRPTKSDMVGFEHMGAEAPFATMQRGR